MTMIKKHKILSFALASYALIWIMSMPTAIQAGRISVTYFIEMLQILPAVFIITSLIQTWVPTNVIIRHFGDGSGVHGLLISLLIGSLSAGPIYAAFPICKTLMKKGAAVTNVVIILSAWAVIKIPMLINEVKFMGWDYMLIRWTFTIVAVLIMAAMMNRLMGTDRPASEGEEGMIDHKRCLLCNACVNKYPEVFSRVENKIIIRENLPLEDQHKTACPLGAIS